MPNRSIDTPITSCMMPNEKWYAAAHSPSCCGDRCSSPASGGPMMAATVRNDWLSVKPLASASRMAQATRGGKWVLAGGGGALDMAAPSLAQTGQARSRASG